MPLLYRKLSLFLVSLYLAGILGTGYLLYKLPDMLLSSSPDLDLLVLQDINPVLTNINLVFGIVLTLGLLAIILLLMFNRKDAGENIVYVESFANHNNIKGKEEQYREDADNNNGHGDRELNQRLEEKKGQILKKVENEKNLETALDKVLSEICGELEASQATVYKTIKQDNVNKIQLIASFAFPLPESETVTFEFGEGLAGQVAKEGKLVNINNVPQGYINIVSGLGSASPNNLVIVPLKNNGKVYGVAEIASFKTISSEEEGFLQDIFNQITLKISQNSKEKTRSKASGNARNSKESNKKS